MNASADLLDWAEKRDEAMAQVEATAVRVDPQFPSKAAVFILGYLKEHGPTSGEILTLECKKAGIIPHDDRAFGPVYYRLAKANQIERVGTCIRKRGHGTRGGSIWGIKQ